MTEYPTFQGFVQFDPEPKQVGEQTVREVVIDDDTTEETTRVRVTLWPDYDEAEVAKGDYVIVQGRYNQGRSQDGSKVYHNLSAYNLVVLPPAPKAERKVVSKSGGAARKGKAF